MRNRSYCRPGGWLLGLFILLLPGPQAASAETRLTMERTNRSFDTGDPVWILKLTDGSKLLASWQAASGVSNRQKLDRVWSPGNGAPLPPGRYRLGPPEPLGQGLWIDLLPEFATSRSALGIHNCLPGVGCICIPGRKELFNLSEKIQRFGIQTLTVVN